MRSDAGELGRILTPDELDRAERYRIREDRERYVITRGLLRTILGRYLNRAPANIRFSYGPHGKPAVHTQTGENAIHFSLSRSHHLAVYAIACRRRVGIDLEYIRPIPEMGDIVERFFSAQEKAEFGALAPEGQLGAFFDWWTRKEAYLKARGVGLALGLDRFDVSIAPEEPARLLNVRGDEREASRWSLCDIAPSSGYAAALAVEGHDWNLSFWDWTE
jgi:4'-phosphopantetheinyl transferase